MQSIRFAMQCAILNTKYQLFNDGLEKNKFTRITIS